MSLNRLIYYSAIIGGWSAFLGWMASEICLNRVSESSGRIVVILTCALVGGAIGAGLNLVAGMANGQWKQQVKRVVPGLLAGGVGGAVGGLIGDVLYGTFQLPRAFGWMLMGAGIGVVEGLYEQSKAKLRNGLIGGAVGGMIGGFLFDPIQNAISSQSAMSSRATAFVILGMCIGVLIGLVKVVFKEAWLTVLDGYRPGRQLILSEGRIVLGRAEHAALPFMGRSDNELEMEHALVLRQPDGRFVLEDNGTRQGTTVNNARVNGPVTLKDNDVIRMGSNTVRFSEHHGRAAVGAPSSAATVGSSPPLPVTGMKPYAAPAIPAPRRPTPAPPPSPAPQPPVSPTQQPPISSASSASPTRQAAAPPSKPAPAPQPPSVAHPPAKPPAKTTTPVSPGAAGPAKTAPEGMVLCPNGHPVPKTQRYCIQCDTYF